MTIKALLYPLITQHLTSRGRLLALRARAERRRVSRRAPHEVHYFHQADDPYSTLVASILPALAARYDVALVPHVVGPVADGAAPERDKLVAYSRRDAQLLAGRWGLAFRDAGAQPSRDAVERANGLLVAAVLAGRFVELAGPLSASLWQGSAGSGSLAPAPPAAVGSHLQQSGEMRRRLGHYLGATFFYGGEWYWGLDRLYHLEERLQELGAARAGVRDLMFPPSADLRDAVPLQGPPAIDFFGSLRSPYTAIVAPRVFALGRLTGAPVRLRFVLPMVMRGLPVPREKRMYILHDTAREAFARGIPFGRLNDPVGRPTERGLAVLAHAERAGKGEGYLLSFLRGVWAEGLDAGSDRGLRTIVERAGLSWDTAREALKDEAWRQTAEENRRAMFDLGLWGVPSFRVGDLSTWGQDRLWAVQEEVLRAARP